jgi:retron-type reverse transcriptase
MPVRVGYLYENTYDYDFVKLSIKLALQAKGTDPNTPDGRTVRLIKSDPDKYTRKLCRKMEREEFRPSAPIKQIRYEGINKKKRIVQKPRLYPDHIVHWITIRAIQPVLERGMYEYCCGNIPGRGIAEVRRILTKTLQGKGNYTPEGQVKLKKKGLRYKYCLKMDIHHFYQSINQDLLIEQLHGVIKDPRMMKLLIKIIKSTGPGLPIGYYTSQWLANFHLQELDHYIK